jgi:hypothetical protein
VSEFTLKFDFNALHQRFSFRTGCILERAAFLLTAAADATKNLGLMPAVDAPTVPVRFAARPLPEVRTEAARWVAESAFRDCIEEVQILLEEVRLTCAALSLLGDEQIPTDKYNEVVVGPAAKFDKRNFPDKVSYLRGEFGADLLDARIDDILTLNAARNCLVHRQGIVGERDCDGTGHLLVRWKTFELHARGPNGEEVPLGPGIVAKGGSQLLAKHQVIEKSFAVGDSLIFTPTDLSGIWLTLHFFGVGTAKQVADRGQAAGLVFRESDPTT